MAGAGGVGIGLFGAVTGVAWLGAVVPVAGLVGNGTRTVTQAEEKGFRSNTGDTHERCRFRS
jgi:hypothetical protein